MCAAASGPSWGALPLGVRRVTAPTAMEKKVEEEAEEEAVEKTEPKEDEQQELRSCLKGRNSASSACEPAKSVTFVGIEGARERVLSDARHRMLLEKRARRKSRETGWWDW